MYSVMSNVHIFSKQVIIFYQYRLSNKLLTTFESSNIIRIIQVILI